MNDIYVIKPGDTLLQIAFDNNVHFVDLLALNPKYQKKPDLIFPGDGLKLPIIVEDEIETIFEIEPISNKPQVKDGCVKGQPFCKTNEICDILFVTGEKPEQYYLLDVDTQKSIEDELSITDKLIQDYGKLLEESSSIDSTNESALNQHKKKKQAWFDQATYAGVIKKEQQSDNTEKHPKKPASEDTPQRIRSQIKSLQDRRRIIHGYVPFYGLTSESSKVTLKNKVVETLDREIAAWEAKLDKPQNPESSNKQNIDLHNLGHKKLITTNPKRHVVEVWMVSKNRLVYLRADFVEKARRKWITNPVKDKLATAIANKNSQAIQKALFDDIKKGLPQTAKQAAFGKLEGKFKEWKLQGGKFAEWKLEQTLENDQGEIVFAASEEAQLLRYAAQASVNATLEPAEGKIDIGVGAEASFALAEGAVKAKRFFPHKNGYNVQLSYLDAMKHEAMYPCGRFRADLEVLLSCFVGVMGQANIKLTNQPQDKGASGAHLLLSPDINVGPKANGEVGLSAGAFAGAQAGGQIAGSLQWEPPENIYTGNFGALAEIKAGGNVAFGAGASLDFMVELTQEGKFLFYCSGKLVFGPGGSGGFGTSVDFDKIWELAKVIWGAIQVIDYRFLKNINKDAYDFLYKAAYMAFSAPQQTLDALRNPGETLDSVISSGVTKVNEWWDDRTDHNDRQEILGNEAKILSQRILNSRTFSEISADLLPPQTVGMMLNTLLVTFYFSWEEKQERAIFKLLNESIYSWRKFEEVLACINDKGEKQAGDKVLFHNIDRLNAILDGYQQNMFNSWVNHLASTNRLAQNQKGIPFTPYKNINNKKDNVVYQLHKLNKNGADFFV
ncbi:LysM peptidoglycan-binding domain-containing protein [Enterovibrio sp. ZSDZ35]|uniref:LysM peptidoglycan-binding domain-containing protein n=1 Tax=Enterovibrio qingdaonensis TaxID=2899818 RepID=A0ABT5QJD3_9GAMM|nr:LysM domain-containing protein [Enterovibrio sp. ZSDZ35]MDD1781102.1 LysM peptidoglycan-binding domain-containing protein [Enterovibrio sp. ZSDZ35]